MFVFHSFLSFVFPSLSPFALVSSSPISASSAFLGVSGPLYRSNSPLPLSRVHTSVVVSPEPYSKPPTRRSSSGVYHFAFCLCLFLPSSTSASSFLPHPVSLLVTEKLARKPVFYLLRCQADRCLWLDCRL